MIIYWQNISPTHVNLLKVNGTSFNFSVTWFFFHGFRRIHLLFIQKQHLLLLTSLGFISHGCCFLYVHCFLFFYLFKNSDGEILPLQQCSGIITTSFLKVYSWKCSVLSFSPFLLVTDLIYKHA